MTRTYIDRMGGHKSSYIFDKAGNGVTTDSAKRFFKHQCAHQKRRQARAIEREAIREWMNNFYWCIEDTINRADERWDGDSDYNDFDEYLQDEDERALILKDDDDFDNWGGEYPFEPMTFKFVRITISDLRHTATILTNRGDDDLVVRYVGPDYAVLKLTDVQQAMLFEHNISYRYDWSHEYGC